MGTDVRRNMIRSAAVLFRERGIAGTSLADVVEHSGAPRGSIYHHFPGGKNQLAEEATRWAGGVITRMVTRTGDDPVAMVRGFVAFWRSELTRDFQTSCPVVAAALAATESQGAYDAAGEVFTDWTKIVADALANRGIPSSRATSTASLIICSIEGAVVVARARRSLDPLDEVEAELVRLIGHLLVDAS